jgi:elongation factor P
MLKYTDLKKGVVFSFENNIWVVLEFALVKMQSQKPTLKTKIRNLKTGAIVMKAFTQAQTFEEVETENKKIMFVYGHRGKYTFSEIDDPSKRMEFDEEFLGDIVKYLKPKSEVDALIIDGQIAEINVPIKMALKVTECPPGFKGNTVTGGTKVATLETGVQVSVPMFIEVGDEVLVNTEEGNYIERVSKN